MENEIINDAIELVKNIPPIDKTPLEKFEDTEWTDVLVPLQWQDTDIPPYPVVEYEVVVESSLHKFNIKVNEMIKQWWSALWWVNVVHTSTWVKFYQAMERWNVDWEEKRGLNIPGLEDEPDLYENIQ